MPVPSCLAPARPSQCSSGQPVVLGGRAGLILDRPGSLRSPVREEFQKGHSAP